MPTLPCLLSHPGFHGGSWRSVRKRRVPSSGSGGPRDGLGQPQPPPNLIAQVQKPRLREGTRRFSVTQLASCLGSAFSPGYLSHPDLGSILAPPFTCCAASVSQDGKWRGAQHLAPCTAGGTHGAHRWRKSSFWVPGDPANCPASLWIPKPSPHSAHCPEEQASVPWPHGKASAHWDVNWGPLQLSFPPCKWIWQCRGGAGAWRQPGEGGRQAGSWGWWEESSLPCLQQTRIPVSKLRSRALGCCVTARSQPAVGGRTGSLPLAWAWGTGRGGKLGRGSGVRPVGAP